MNLPPRLTNLVAGGITLACLMLLASAPASNAASSDRLVTIAARVCPEYTDITANRARNNIQESLRDLGRDTPYSSGELVDATVEDTVQPNCRPIEGWKLTLGRGYRSRASTGPWGSLSIVTSPFDHSIVTRNEIPLLNSQGSNTGQKLEGAVTIELTEAEKQLASKNSSLWIQGGLPNDPVLYPGTGGAYGFGALRCASDNYNGDNVEWIAYPSGAQHVFCFAYYVSPPPTAGTIIVRKKTVGDPAGSSENFDFKGNISYAEGGDFSINAGGGKTGQQSFARAQTLAGDEPWSFREYLPSNWVLDDLDCVSATGGSTTSVNPESLAASVRLAASDTVTCTYTNRYRPPNGGLLIRKTTYGDTGRFEFKIDPLDDGATEKVSANTVEEGIPENAPTADLEPGRYRIVETSPDAGDRGDWASVGIRCDGEELDPKEDPVVTIKSGESVVCDFENRYTPAGSIMVRVVTVNGTGSVSYLVSSNNENEPFIGSREATTKAQNESTKTTGDDLSKLPLVGYTIQQNAFRSGNWELISVTCNDRPVAFEQGSQVQVKLTADSPHEDCTFVNKLTKDEGGTEGPTTGPGPGEVTDGGEVVNPPKKPKDPRLTVTKKANKQFITLGQPVSYRITVKNHGPVKATDVSISEQLYDATTGATLLSAKPSQGRCLFLKLDSGISPTCQFGTIKSNHKAVVKVKIEPTRTGRYKNIVAAGTDTLTTGNSRLFDIESIRVQAPGNGTKQFPDCRALGPITPRC